MDKPNITKSYFDAADPQYDTDPSLYYAKLRDEHPVYKHPDSGVYMISRFEDVWDISANWVQFSSAHSSTACPHMASTDRPEHTVLRGSVSRDFTTSAVRKMEESIRRICKSTLDPLVEHGKPVDIMSQFLARYPSDVISHMLGVKPETGEQLRLKALEIGAAVDVRSLAKRMHEFESLSADACKAGFNEGILSSLETSDVLTPIQLQGILSNLVLAGTDTVTNLLGNALVILYKNPEQREKLVLDPSRIPGAIEETLRFEPPVQSLGRTTTTDCELHGSIIPKGCEVRLLWGAANRDDREFEQANVFNIERKIKRHLGFGHGVHFCLGARLARMEAKVALEEILRAAPNYGIDESGLVRLPSLWVRAWEDIPFSFKPCPVAGSRG